jgi:hypothetical protein
MRRRVVDPERGSMALIVAGLCMVLLFLAIGGATVGRIVAVKKDVQRAADAACLSASHIVRQQGMPLTATKRLSAEVLAKGNVKVPVVFNWLVDDQDDEISFTCTSTATLEVPDIIYPSGLVTVAAKAKGRVGQNKFDEVERRLPKFTMVLDYSGSMEADQNRMDNGQTRLEVLEESILNLLDQDYDIDYAAVFFSERVEGAVDFGANAVDQIRQFILDNDSFLTTCISCGLRQARQFIAPTENTGRYVLFVGDGDPTEANGSMAPAQAEANLLWNLDTTIFTLHIFSPGQPRYTETRDKLISISGTPASRSDTRYYYRADSANTLREAFGTIVSSLLCTTAALTPPPTDPTLMFGFLKSGAGDERAMTRVGTAAALSQAPCVVDGEPAGECFWYDPDPAKQNLRLSAKACEAVLQRSEDIIVRYDDPALTL